MDNDLSQLSYVSLTFLLNQTKAAFELAAAENKPSHELNAIYRDLKALQQEMNLRITNHWKDTSQ